MEFIKETKKKPKLTYFKPVPKIKEPIKLTNPIKENTKWNLNIIILICFILFLIFFLYNCKYGMFKSMYIEPYAFNS
jgi:hypothetical protein